MYKTLQEQVQPRMLAILLLSLLLLTAVAGYLYVLKKPMQQLNQSKQALQLLEREVDTGVSLESQIAIFEGVVKTLNLKLRGTGPELPVNQMIAFVIGQLDHIAAKHAVNLVSVKPATAGRIFTFRELPFNVELQGSYFSLFEWLYEVEKELGPIVIKQFEFTEVGNSKQRHLRLVIASYQFVDS
jgi:Tfp pilus assembly protein PilO